MSLASVRSELADRVTREELLIGSGIGLFLVAVAGAVAVGRLKLPFVVSSLAFAPVILLLALGLNVQWGYGGLVNFSVAAFFAVGAYSTAVLTNGSDPHGLAPHPAVGLVAAMAVSAVLALAIGLPTLRLRADYFAIATLGFAEIVRLIILNEGWLTNGGLGVFGIPVLFEPGVLSGPAELLNTTPRNIGNVLIGFLAVAVVFLVLRRVQSSPWGRVLRTIRADEDVGQALGKNTYRFKLQAFVLGSVIMGVAGFYFAHYIRAITPGAFEPIQTFYVWVAVILGGSGSNRGAILGGFVVVLILRGTRLINDPVGAVETLLNAPIDVLDRLLFSVTVDFRLSLGLELNQDALRLLLIGLLVIAIVRLRPQGLLPPQREHIWPAALGGDEPDREDRE